MKKSIQSKVIDKLKDDMEILANKSEFDELLNVEKTYFENVESFNSTYLNGQMLFMEFGTMYSRSNMATVKSVHGIRKDDDVYQYEVQLSSNGPMRIGWATQRCAIVIYIFFSNGQSLGVIFEELLNKDDLTYFPTLTLSDEENVVVNLGERPFKFPVLSSKPIITSPIALINYFRRLEKNINSLIESQISLNKINDGFW
ncbi:uncharacterized protein LOC113561072 [Rhopalosiphum maidis]|uniref:uncharacterized protein LOC113561072 n=1 Tax=Rhopalosiphum maidis TaxID=43146 RepID=UPI000EFDFCE4|nr:uncharacterized protein LOC113561072 [Rhopalosiphum maidis]